MLQTTPDLYYLCLTGRTRFSARQLMLQRSLNPGAQSCQAQPSRGCDGGLHKGLSLGTLVRRAALPLLHLNPCPGRGMTQAPKGHVLQQELNSHTPHFKKRAELL